jgi:small neutral amino acid transporter SnatA (MarC family)
MDFSVINSALVLKLLLLLLIGMGPKIALVPFLEKTKHLDAATQRAVGRQMVMVAVVTALVLFATGALLMRLLHITGGAVAVAGGIILVTLAIEMVHGPGKKIVEGAEEPAGDPMRMAIYPLAVPYLLNPVGMTVLIISSAEVVSVASAGLVVALVLLVGAFDYWLFSNIDKVSKRLNPTSLVVSEVVFGILLTAVAVQLVVSGLDLLGIIALPDSQH